MEKAIFMSSYETYIVPFGTVMFSPSKIIFGLFLLPYFLKALLTQTACFCNDSTEEICVCICGLRVFNSNEAVRMTGGSLIVSISTRQKK